MKKGVWSIALAAAALLLFANAASAHVTVNPKEVQAGAYQVFTVRVPSESKNKHTTSVTVDIPAQVKITRTQPVPGWSYELKKDAEGHITAVSWKAEGPGLAETEFQDFQLSGRVADDAASLTWVAHQTYDDGTVIDWAASDENAEFPASVTTVAAPAGKAESAGGTRSWTLGLSIASLALSAAALVIALARRRKG
ncbi:YcnI family protein [Paenibacillus thailandensis]|uniref:YcnI family protein n=1 Tax=Paenibacillus thailandensis TaxID=393250 RepID=A0ABW5QS15_9BACL